MVFFSKRLFAKLDRETFVPNAKFAHPETSQTLSVKDFSLSIDGQQILDKVNVELPPNKITCIIGPSGCGKSTLLKSINRLTSTIEKVKTSGDILLGNDSIENANQGQLVELRRRVGLVPQRPTPLPMSIFNNVAFGCKIHGLHNRRQLKKTVRHYLKVVGLWDEVKDRLNAPATALSIGQQQRLCLARSLAVEPEYVLADEVTSALDPVSAKTVEDLFTTLKEQYSIVMVTHTLSQAKRIADYVVFIYLGKVIETGSAKDVFENPQNELTKKYLEGQFA